MAIQMTCACGANLSFDEAQLGQSGPCYQCGQTVTVAPQGAGTMANPQAPVGQAPFPQQPSQPQVGGAPGSGYGGPSGGYGGPSGGYGGPAGGYGGPVSGTSQSKEAWGWRYSPFVGVMYGPIPVGIIVVAIGGLIYLAAQL